MPATVIVGGQWGDEGKAKIVDYLMADHHVVVRYQGGANAGHTVVTGGRKFAFHQIPSGVLYPKVVGILGNGMVIDPFYFLEELEGLVSEGIETEGSLFISSGAQVVMPYHKMLDKMSESDLQDKSIGSTGKGIGPAYSDKHSRRGMRMGDFLLNKEALHELVMEKVDFANRLLEVYHAPALSPRKVATDFVNIRDSIAPFVRDTQPMISRLEADDKMIMLEGAQGTLLDIDHGTYPYVTSSSCTVGGAVSGSGLSPTKIARTIGIFKAYTTRVGNGPFPTELKDSTGERLRKRGKEFGTTTGRPRRCGWFDLVAARYSVTVNGLKEIALTKLDVISGMSEIKLCVGYQLEGEKIDYFPLNHEELKRCVPVYENVKGWGDEKFPGSYQELPAGAREYVERIEKELGVKATFISTGPGRKETIIRDHQVVLD